MAKLLPRVSLKERRTVDVFELSREELDTLPYGVITLDRRGLILRYNFAEAAFARRKSETTIGLGFFTDVAPCTNVQAFKGRFDRFASEAGSGVERFDFIFAFRWGSQEVSITLLRKAEHEEINLIVQANSMPLHDRAVTAIVNDAREFKSARRRDRSETSRKYNVGAQERQCTTAWLVGSAQESLWHSGIHNDDVAERDRIAAAAAALAAPYVVEYRTLNDAGTERIVVENGSFAGGPKAPGYVTIVDITQRRQQEREVWELAHYDRTTGLPNRSLLVKRIAFAAAEAASTGRVAAVLAIAFPQAGAANTVLGFGTGDGLLRLIALRLGESVREGDTVARLHDGFVVLLTDVESVVAVSTTAERILAAVSEPFALMGRSHHLAASIGISVAPHDGTESEALLDAAEAAVAGSERAGRYEIAWFSREMLAEQENVARAEEDLRSAIERDEFVLYYQPIVDVASGRVVAVEALVRWNHPERGVVMPGDFIGIAERAGLIVPLGEWVLRAACRQAKIWLEAGFDIHVCVNVSAVQFRERSFVTCVLEILARAGVPPQMLEIELTESVVIDSFNEVIESLKKLKLAGVRIAIDDFGTGYSSLSYLKHFPLDTLKLDRAFVADIAKDPCDWAIAKAVLTLAKDLGLHCVAEGIETSEQRALLDDLGCRRMQGYFFSKPQLPATLERVLRDAWLVTPSPIEAS